MWANLQFPLNLVTFTKEILNGKLHSLCGDTTIFIGPRCCGKTHLVLYLIEKEYNNFDYIIIICPTLWWNKTYHSKNWIKNDDKVWLTEPKHRVYQWIQKLPELLPCSETLFIIDDITADEGLDKKRQSLLELAISGRHRDHYLW